MWSGSRPRLGFRDDGGRCEGATNESVRARRFSQDGIGEEEEPGAALGEPDGGNVVDPVIRAAGGAFPGVPAALSDSASPHMPAVTELRGSCCTPSRLAAGCSRGCCLRWVAETAKGGRTEATPTARISRGVGGPPTNVRDCLFFL